MKKCMFALCAFVVCALPVVAEDFASMDENPDSIKVTYVPNRFADNWELSVVAVCRCCLMEWGTMMERHPLREHLLVVIKPMMPLVE